MEEPVVEPVNNLNEPEEIPTSCTHFAQSVCSRHFILTRRLSP